MAEAEEGGRAGGEVPMTPEPQQAVGDRRLLRSEYHAVKSLISGRVHGSRAKLAALVLIAVWLLG